MADGKIVVDTDLDVSGFKDGLSKLNSIATKGLKATATAVTAVGSGLAAMAGYAVKAGSDFEAAMSQVEAISGASSQTVITASGDMVNGLEAVTEKAKEMGAATKFSATESAEALNYMAMAGWDAQAMYEGLPGIMNLAAASGENLATTSDIVTDALTAFGMTASESGHFADILAQASASANTNVSLLGESFKYVAPLCGTLNYSAEDAAVALGLMANAGIKGSQAGTALKTALANLSAPTDKQAGMMDKLGISLQKSDGTMKSLREVMKDLRSSFKNLNEAEKTAAASTIFGKEAMSGMLNIINASDEDFEKLTNAIDDCGGAAEEMANIMQDNLQGQIVILQSALEGLGIAVYEHMQEPLRDVVEQAQLYIGQLTTAFENAGFEGLVSEIGIVLADLVTKITEAAPEMVKAAVSLCDSFIESIVSNGDAIAEAGAELVATLATGVLNSYGNFVGAGIELVSLFLKALSEHASEIGAAAAHLVTTLASAVIENAPVIIETGKEIIRGFLKGMEEELPQLSALLSGFFEGYVGTLEPIISSVTSAVAKLFGTLSEANPETLEAIGRAIGTIAASITALKVAGKVVKGVKELFTVLGSLKSGILGITGTISKIVEGFALWKGGAGSLIEVIELEFPKLAAVITKVGTAITSVGGFFTKVASIISTAWSHVVSFFTTFGSTITGVGAVIGGAVLAVTNFVDMFVNGFQWIKEILMVVGIALAAVGAVILGAPALVAGVVAGIVAAVGTLVVVIKDNWTAIVEFFQGIPEAVGSVVDSIVEWFSELPTRIGEWLNSTIENISAWGTELYESACSAVSNVIDSIVQFFSDLPYKIGYAIGTVIGTLILWYDDIKTWITTNVPLIIDSIVKFFTELPGKVAEWFTKTVDKAKKWGTDMIAKAVEVGTNFLNKIIEFFKQLPGKVQSWLDNVIQKVSTWVSQMIQKAVETGTNFLNKIVEFFSQLPGKIWNWLSKTIEKATKFVSDLAKKGKEAAKQFATNLESAMSSIPGKMAEIGKNIVQGVWNGIKGMGSWFEQQVSSFFSGIVDGVKNVLGIHSPSTVFDDEVGRWILPGVGKGVKKTQPDLNRTMKNAAGEMVDAFNNVDEIDYSVLASKMKKTVIAEIGDITQDVTIKSNTGSSQVRAMEGERFNYDRLGTAFVEALTAAGLRVEMDERELGRLIAEFA